jgi:DNA-binding response OmpR family regulator
MVSFLAVTTSAGTMEVVMARILVVEDEKLINIMFREALENEGYEMDAAYDGQEGVEMHRKHPFDLIIADIMMPRTDGVQMITKLRERFPDVKILVVTAISLSGPHYREMKRKLAGIPILQKPVTKDTLVSKVRALLGE